MFFSCHLRREGPKAGCGTGQECAVPKITCDVSDRKPAPTKMDFFVESARTKPEATDRHRQSPLRVHSNSPKNRRFAAGGSVHCPFSSGSVPPTEMARWLICINSHGPGLYRNDLNKENARTRRRDGQRPHRNGKRPPNTFLNPQIQTSREYLWSRCGKARFVSD